ncbi:chromosome partitioning protein [Natrinema zhouii]|uniref:Chromosome partitioning protein n=1 Tax=Natrinema zhouii TaxID=1710539 RepID=A0A7D6CT53_9EURY|nr:chromosome partitioning protein [Natrinema zhouii]QLK27251.1 chromosome partitioning protein [Natrinema zhouii]
MIAIAGAKGGCGTTVTTIGLAEAVGRRGTVSIAVDADCQLPNLHVAGGVDRTPTLAALESDANVESVVQPSPRTSNAGLLSAPDSSDEIDFEAVFERLESDTGRAFVDCPSGAGPDVVEPLSAADGMIVVTTDSERSITAAETTIEMARRLEVPILGTVVNRCESIPQAVRSWTDVPVLGRVPNGTSPLTDEVTRAAYDDIAATVATRTARDGTVPSYDESLLRTGCDPLDRAFGGGLEPGSMVAVVAAPASCSEQVLSETTAVRGTLYLSTERSAANVQRALETVPTTTGNPTVRRLSRSDRLAEAAAMADKLPTSSTLIIDPVNALERHDRDEYVSFLDDLKEQLVATGSIGLLHCLNGPAIPSNRTVTTHAADAVFEIAAVTPEASADVEHYLSVPKCRADGTMTEPIELEFGDETDGPIRGGF